MKIALVSSLKPTATAVYFVRAFQELSDSVLVISDVAHPLADVLAKGFFDISDVLHKNHFQPDLVLFIEGGTMQLLPMGFEKLECVTAWYGIDTHTDYKKHLYLSRLFDVTFVAQHEYVNGLRSDGIQSVHWLPLACEPSIYPKKELPRCYDIAHVGSTDHRAHPMRHRLLNALNQTYPKMWSGRATVAEMGSIYSQARIVFNASINNDINMRFFEAMGAGAVLVTNPIMNNGVDELFCKNQHYVEYHDERDLFQVIDTLLKDPEKLSSIGAAAQQLVLDKHTYRQRGKACLETIKQAPKKPARPLADDYLLALKALRLDQEFFRYLGNVYRTRPGSRRQRFNGFWIGVGCRLIAVILGAMNYLRVAKASYGKNA